MPVGVVSELVGGDVYHWGSLMAGSLPVSFIYSFFVECHVSGMTGSVNECAEALPGRDRSRSTSGA